MTAPDPVAVVGQHTRGPWWVQKDGITVCPPKPRGQSIICRAAEVYMSRVEREANARLIAAAPDLLDVAESAPIASKYHGAGGFEADRFLSDYEAWRVKARAALAAARGAQVVA